MSGQYFNTNGLTGESLNKASNQCIKQEDRILLLFKKYGHRGLTADRVHYLYLREFEDDKRTWKGYCEDCQRFTPLDSIKRGITNLTESDLSKSDKRKETAYGSTANIYLLDKTNEND